MDTQQITPDSNTATVETPANNTATADTSATTADVSSWASYEDLEKTPWLSELAEDRRNYILSGAKSRQDYYESLLAEKTSEANVYRQFVEAENPEYFADKERATKLEADVKAAQEEVTAARAELQRLKDEGASNAEIKKQADEVRASMEALKASNAALLAEKDELVKSHETAGAEFHEMTDHLAGLLFDKAHGNVSPAARAAAKATFMKFMANNVEEFDAAGKPMQDLIAAAYAAADEKIPKPDNVPASVKVQGGASQKTGGVDDDAVVRDFFADKSEDSTAAVAKKHGIGISDVTEALVRYRERLRGGS